MINKTGIIPPYIAQKAMSFSAVEVVGCKDQKEMMEGVKSALSDRDFCISKETPISFTYEPFIKKKWLPEEDVKELVKAQKREEAAAEMLKQLNLNVKILPDLTKKIQAATKLQTEVENSLRAENGARLHVLQNVESAQKPAKITDDPDINEVVLLLNKCGKKLNKKDNQ